MDSSHVRADTPVPAELAPIHAALLKKSLERRRMPFLIISALGIGFTVYSTLFLELQLRLLGVAIFSALVIPAFFLFKKQQEQYEKWKHLDLVRLGEASDFDASLEQEFHESFRTEGALIMAAIDEAVEKSDIKELGEQAHKLKGSALTIGYPEVGATTMAMEKYCKANTVERAKRLVPKLKRQMRQIDVLMGEYFAFRSRLEEGGKESKKER